MVWWKWWREGSEGQGSDRVKAFAAESRVYSVEYLSGVRVWDRGTITVLIYYSWAKWEGWYRVGYSVRSEGESWSWSDVIVSLCYIRVVNLWLEWFDVVSWKMRRFSSLDSDVKKSVACHSTQRPFLLESSSVKKNTSPGLRTLHPYPPIRLSDIPTRILRFGTQSNTFPLSRFTHYRSTSLSI